MRGLGMKQAYCVGGVGALLVAFCLVFTPSFAQQGSDSPHFAGDIEKLQPEPPGGPAPRTPDGHPDLSGVWYPNSAGTEFQIAYLSASPGEEAARSQLDPKAPPDERPSFKPGMAAKYRVPPATDYGECSQAGTPLTGGNFTFPIQLIQTPGLLLLLDEYPMDYRVIRTDGRPHPKDPDPSFNGNSVGHWEGDTLVIDTIALDTRRANGGAPGWFHSDQEHVIERLSRPSMNYFSYQVTIDDPVVLAKPWTTAPRRWSLSIHQGEDLGEFFCTNNEEPEEYHKIAGSK
jgi:hypothetical protein